MPGDDLGDSSKSRTQIVVREVDNPSMSVGSGSVPRRRRSATERRLIVEETLEAGSSVTRIARAHGVNATRLFIGGGCIARGFSGDSVRAIKACHEN
jgi:hypothetical protein